MARTVPGLPHRSSPDLIGDGKDCFQGATMTDASMDVIGCSASRFAGAAGNRDESASQCVRGCTITAAVHVLKACGLYGRLPPRGPTEVEDAVLAAQQHQSARRAALRAALEEIALEKGTKLCYGSLYASPYVWPASGGNGRQLP